MERYSFDNIIADLGQVNDILSKTEDSIVFDDLKSLALFYRHYQDTDTAISTIAASIFDNLDNYEASALSLIESCDRFQQLCAQSAQHWESYDFEGACSNYLKAYELPYENAKKAATTLWQRMQSLSNRLDYMPFDDPEYNPLMTECDAMWAEYHDRSSVVKRLNQVFHAKKNYVAEVYFFKMAYLVVLVELWGNIAESLKKDVERIKMGD